MNTSRVTIKAGSGSHNLLDRAYNKFIKQSFLNGDDNTYERWVTYNFIIKELIQLNRLKCFEEMKYRLTGGEDMNNILIDIISRDEELSDYLPASLNKLNQYKIDDLLIRFTK